jgi:hypothetical protein
MIWGCKADVTGSIPVGSLPVHRQATRVLALTALGVLMASVAIIGAGRGVALAGQAAKPCAKVTMDFFPTRVTAGQAMDMNFSIENCSARDERLVVRLSSRGPCPFISASSQRYDLGPGEGTGQSGLFTAPDCTGHYRVKARVFLGHRRLDKAHAGFTVTSKSAG